MFIIENTGEFHEDITGKFATLDEAVRAYGSSLAGMRIIETSDYPAGNPSNYRWNGRAWEFMGRTGEAWDEQDGLWYDHDTYRRILHERTTDDTMEALRKMREGESRIDWQAWLDALDAYNAAVSDTVNQPTYPDSVVYPDYPSRPQ